MLSHVSSDSSSRGPALHCLPSLPHSRAVGGHLSKGVDHAQQQWVRQYAVKGLLPELGSERFENLPASVDAGAV
jgi:hypothetical protein